jgi:uncharacterized surface protein with fasciclin (FAS1) repeats
MVRYPSAAATLLCALPLGMAALPATAADLVQTVQEAAEPGPGPAGLGTLAEAIEAAGLADELKGGGPYTLFAPSDAAFAELSLGGEGEDAPRTVTDLLDPEHKETLTELLKYHLVEGEVEFPDLVQSQELETVQGGTLELQSTHHGVRINDQANIMATEIVAANGIIHPIDAVLLPPEFRE